MIGDSCMSHEPPPASCRVGRHLSLFSPNPRVRWQYTGGLAALHVCHLCLLFCCCKLSILYVHAANVFHLALASPPCSPLLHAPAGLLKENRIATPVAFV